MVYDENGVFNTIFLLTRSTRSEVLKCLKIYRKSVLHLPKYTANVYAGQICSTFWDTQYIGVPLLCTSTS